VWLFVEWVTIFEQAITDINTGVQGLFGTYCSLLFQIKRDKAVETFKKELKKVTFLDSLINSAEADQQFEQIKDNVLQTVRTEAPYANDAQMRGLKVRLLIMTAVVNTSSSRPIIRLSRLWVNGGTSAFYPVRSLKINQ